MGLRDIIRISNSKIFNIQPHTFDLVRNGDMIAIMNVVEHLRQRENRQDISFYIEPAAMAKNPYCEQFLKFLQSKTNHLVMERGENILNKHIHVWTYRMEVGDLIKLPNHHHTQKKICIFPVFDSQYNTYRKWSQSLTQEIINRFSTTEYANYEKVFCAIGNPPFNIDLHDFKLSIDFTTNVDHIMTSEIYVGGDTGLTHFASVLDTAHPKKIYYMSKHSQKDTLPFYHDKGEMNWY